jgi:hypothetical protein
MADLPHQKIVRASSELTVSRIRQVSRADIGPEGAASYEVRRHTDV